MAKERQSEFRYVDHPEIQETFADSLHTFGFHQNTMRLEFTVTRPGPAKSGKPISGTRHTVCRLVLTPEAAKELHGQLSNIAAMMAKPPSGTPVN